MTIRIPAIPITACAVINACGAGTQSLFDALVTGKHYLQSPTLFKTDFTVFVGEVSDQQLPDLDPSLLSFSSRNARIALAAINHPEDGFRDAVNHAISNYGAQRVGIVLGTSTSGIYETENAYLHLKNSSQVSEQFDFANQHVWVATANYLKAELGLQGLCFAISTACSSSSKTLASAQRLIATGVCDAVLVGGVDSLCRMTVHGFNSLDIVSQTPCTPLDKERSGISLGEGAGFLFLEKPKNEWNDCVHLLGCGESSDAYHMTAPHPEGKGAALAMRQAMQQAGIQPQEIDYVNLHATGTVLNDQSEMRAMSQVFTPETRCSGTKGLMGHTLGAAGGIETIISWLALTRDFIPGTCNLNEVDDDFTCAVASQSELNVSVQIAMNNNFGFGGNNTSLVLGFKNDGY